MPNLPIQDQSTPTPGQMLMSQPQQPDPQIVGNTPLAQRLAQIPSGPPQQQAPTQQQPAPPTPQQADAAKHHALGNVTSFLFGHTTDPNTGEPVKQQPGAIFRSLLAGALLGSAMGTEGPRAGSGVGGFLTGVARGGNAVQQQGYQRQIQAQANAQKQQQMSLEQQKFEQEKVQHAATLEQWGIENLMHAREADYRDREQLNRENEQDLNIQKWAIDQGAYAAPQIPNNGVAGNGPGMMQAMIKNPQAFNPPPGMGRLLVKRYDFDGLKYDAKNGWTESGKPVDWSKHLTWTVYYAPRSG